jgi:hemolysin activation/secretion protein
MDSVNFFGLGNETARDADLAASGHYQARQKQLIVSPAIEWPIAGPLRSRLGALLKHVDTERSGTTEAGGTTLASVEAALAMDTRKGILTGQRGVSLFVAGRHTPKMLGNEAAFTKARAEASAVTGFHLLTDMALDLRVTGEKNWGTYPWFEAAFLGGAAQRSQLDTTFATGGHELRGYDLNRFAGDAAVATNAELRMALGKARAFLPVRYGLVALGDAGRVFVAGESSSKWHTGYGGGLWLATVASGTTFQIASTMNATVVRSDERTSFYFSSGFGL